MLSRPRDMAADAGNQLMTLAIAVVGFEHPAVVDVDAAAPLREGRGHVRHGAAELLSSVLKDR